MTSFYLISNELFNEPIIEIDDYIFRHKLIKEDMEFCSHRDRLTEVFADILKRINMHHELLRFLDCEPMGYQGEYFIVEPQKMDDFIHQLEILINWMLQNDDNIYDKDEAYQMLDTVQFETYDWWKMCESSLYPYYCILTLRSLTLFASKNSKFMVIHVWCCG